MLAENKVDLRRLMMHWSALRFCQVNEVASFHMASISFTTITSPLCYRWTFGIMLDLVI